MSIPDGESDARHILTVSVEEYFHGGALSQVVLSRHWDRFESRIDHTVDEALAVLGRHQAKATFFVLGLLAERNPEMVRRIAAAGHEVASRGYWPRGLEGMMAEEFAEDLDRTRKAIEAATGKGVIGYRSPRWISRQDIWILDVLAARGYLYDASINPVLRSFAGAPGFHALGHHQVAGSARGIWEVPVSTGSVLGWRVGIGGGNWMRQLPQGWVRRAVRRWTRRRDEPLVFYFTSWELDHDQPQVTAVSALGRLRQYRNLNRLRLQLEEYLHRYRFGSIAEHLGLHQPDVPLRSGPPPRPVEISSRSGLTAVAIVVPIFNEQENISYLLRTLMTVRQRLGDRYAFELVIVDDCSTDQSWQILQEGTRGLSDVKLVRHERNQGVARAVMSGVRACAAEIVCSIDCDCSYDPMELERMVPLLDGCDMITASPYHPEGQVLNVPRWRLFLSRTLSLAYRKILGVELYTWTSCFRVMRTASIRDIELESGGFIGIAELLIRTLKRGGRVKEYPTLLEARLLGFSKMRTLRTIKEHLRMIWSLMRRKVA